MATVRLADGDTAVLTSGTTLTPDELAAINGAAAPTALNVFATVADLPADELTADELAAIQGAIPALNGANPVVGRQELLGEVNYAGYPRSLAEVVAFVVTAGSTQTLPLANVLSLRNDAQPEGAQWAGGTYTVADALGSVPRVKVRVTLRLSSAAGAGFAISQTGTAPFGIGPQAGTLAAGETRTVVMVGIVSFTAAGETLELDVSETGAANPYTVVIAFAEIESF